MTKNPMDNAHNAPRCIARSNRSGQRRGAPAVRGWRFAGCMVFAAARRRASGMEIIATAEVKGSYRVEKAHSGVAQ
jgi:hypothetical protein